jgi:T4 RnlA family RNA ligase
MKTYSELMHLVSTDESKAFFFADQKKDERTYRIFNYRLASYTDFCKPSALECRGITFDITDPDNVQLVCRPMPKFFNVDENPFSMNLDFSNVKQIMMKMDGSLISSFMHKNEVALKTKGSLHSIQAVEAYALMKNEPEFFDLISALSELKYTVNMEYCAPTNRIVVGYLKPSLTILNVRHNLTGEYITKQELLDSKYLSQFSAVIDSHWVETFPTDGDIVEKHVTMKDVTGIEGYVIQLASGQMVKAKCQWYLTLHRSKDDVTNPRRLFEVAVDEGTDDLKSLFHEDPLVIQTILQMEALVESIYNPLVDKIDIFYETNKHLSRKDYAILGQQTFANEFSLAMNKYLGKEVDVKYFLKKNYKLYGITEGEQIAE